MIITNLAKSPKFFSQTIELIEKAFDYPSNHSFATDFYPLVQEANWDNCHIIVDDEQVTAHVGVLIKELTCGTPIAFIGGIAVDPTQQGKGIFRTLFEQVLERYQNQVAFFVLWSDLAKLYQKFDFYQAGLCYQSGDQAFTPPANYCEKSLSQLNTKELSQLQDLYQNDFCQRQLSLKRQESDWHILTHITSSKLYLKYAPNQTISSYCFVGKGADLTDIIHESAGATDDLMVFKHWGAVRPATIAQSTYLGLFRPGEQKKFSQFISHFLQGQMKITKANPKQISFLHNSTPYSLEAGEFWPLLLGPAQASEFSPVAPPLYFSGLDTI